jgi:hypothetical protein
LFREPGISGDDLWECRSAAKAERVVDRGWLAGDRRWTCKLGASTDRVNKRLR